MSWYYGYEENSQFTYQKYEDKVIYSSEKPRSYEDEYEWFIEICEACNYEPECYDD